MTDDDRRELEASAALGETSMWITAPASDAETKDELENLAHVLNTEVDRFLEDSTQAVPAARYL